MTDIPITNEIKNFIHCKLCIDELKNGEIELSPRDYSEFEIGFSELGLQVWCKRHEANIVHIDFEGVQHSANEGRVVS